MDSGSREARAGIAGGPLPRPVLPQPRWWQEAPFRAVVGVLVAAVLLAASLLHGPWSQGPWSWDLPGGTTLEITQRGVLPLVALVLMPFMPLVGYRKRDVLLVALVPVVGPMLAGISVYRLLSLPRRTWPPGPDEADRVVGVPDDPGAYLLLPTFAAAEALRTAWCDNLHHEHPYPSWRVARQRLHSR